MSQWRLVVFPSGAVIVSVKSCGRISLVTDADGNGLSIHMTTMTCCPKPTGFGEAVTYAKVGICQGGLWAVAEGTKVIEASVDIARNAVKRIYNFLFFCNHFCYLCLYARKKAYSRQFVRCLI